MKTRYRAMELVSAAAVALCLGGLSAAAMAATDEQPQSVKIEASRFGNLTLRRSGSGLAEVTQLSQQVSYADLDLATTRGAHELTSRVEQAATNVCGRLGALYPAGSLVMQWEEENLCVSGAMNGAMKQAKLAIASAERSSPR